MPPRSDSTSIGPAPSALPSPAEDGFVSGRFLSDFFSALERQGVPARTLLGDLPIRFADSGAVVGHVEWSHFADFMRRLENHLDGPTGLEHCAEELGDLAPASALRALAGLTASPEALYRAGARWALRRAMPGVCASVSVTGPSRLEISVQLAEGLRPCPQLFHFATGSARALPGLIGLGNAVVTSKITPTHATYRVIVPPSLSLLARMKRFPRTIFSSGSVVHYLEAQQVELHAKNNELQRALDALEESERRYNAIVDTAVDVLCEIDESGRIVYVSRSIQDLIGYAPDQVTGSHFRLWIPRKYHESVSRRFDSLTRTPNNIVIQERLELHSELGAAAYVELTARGYLTPEGSHRIVCILRDLRGRSNEARSATPSDTERAFEPLLAPQDTPNLAEQAASPGAAPSAESWEALLFNSEQIEPAGWIETRKIFRTARDMFLASPTGLGYEVEIDVSQAPVEIWSAESHLLIGLAKSLEWAAECCAASAVIRLAATTTQESGGKRTVSIDISVPREPNVDETSGNITERQSRAQPALKLAEESIALLKGSVCVIENSEQTAGSPEAPPRIGRRITLSQPQPPHPRR